MENPYLTRVAARMEADQAYEQLKRHWSSRAWWAIQRVAYHLDRIGLERAAQAYLVAAEPLCTWLGHRQAVFLRRWM